MNPIFRSIYRAQAKAEMGEHAVAWLQQQIQSCQLGSSAGELMTISLFRWGAHFLLYWESVAHEVLPETLFGHPVDLLECWHGGDQPQVPNQRCFVPMMDIFHCLAPQSVEHWRRKSEIERVVGRVARLQPPRVSSYIFYHYQLQEEKPGSFDKYGIIALHENLIFFYQEIPFIVEEPLPIGKLTTHNTPADWHGTMFPHFKLWEDAPAGQEIWRDVELILHR